MFLTLGLILGLWLDRQIYVSNLKVIYYVFPTLYVTFFALSYNGHHTLRLLITSFATALFTSLPLLPFTFWQEPKYINHLICFLAGYPIFIYTAHCYHYAYHQDSTIKVSYKSLFAAVWNTIPLISLAFFFLASTQAILILGSYAYKSIGNDFLWQWYFGSMHFRVIANSIFFFIGLNICQQNIQVIYNLRTIIVKAMYYLFPLVVVISFSYFFFLFSNTMFYKQSIPLDLNVLIPLIFLGILFFNAYIQDADDNNFMPNSYHIFIKFYRIILFILTIMLAKTVLAIYTFDINILVYLLSSISLTATYFLTIFCSKEKELKYVKSGNIYTSLFCLIALFLINIPYAPVIMVFNKT